MDKNNYFIKVPELKIRFWDTFIIDALINNNDRNDNNWGLILNHNSMKLRIAPVFDNGAAFYNKSSNEKISTILNDEFKTKQVIYDSCISSFTKDGRIINPLKFIEKMENIDCNKALLRIFPKIDMKKIKEIFDNIPSNYDNLDILTKEQKELYYQSLIYKYEKVFTPIYNKLSKEQPD